MGKGKKRSRAPINGQYGNGAFLGPFGNAIAWFKESPIFHARPSWVVSALIDLSFRVRGFSQLCEGALFGGVFCFRFPFGTF